VKNWTPTGAAIVISIQSMGAALAYSDRPGQPGGGRVDPAHYGPGLGQVQARQ